MYIFVACVNHAELNQNGTWQRTFSPELFDDNDIIIVFNTTFNSISWGSVLLVEETGIPKENYQPASYWQILPHIVVSWYDIAVDQWINTIRRSHNNILWMRLSLFLNILVNCNYPFLYLYKIPILYPCVSCFHHFLLTKIKSDTLQVHIK